MNRLALATLIAALAWALWARTPAPLPGGPLVEVDGAWVRADTVALAIRAVGGSGGTNRRVGPADRIVRNGPEIGVLAASDPLLGGARVDVNRAPRVALESVPGVGPSLAGELVRSGPYWAVDDLDAVKGVGTKTLAGITPFVTVGDVGPRPPPKRIDVNTATAAELETLPGIGPALAARIVADRDRRGRFRTVDALDRVKGIGPRTVARLRDLAEAG